MKKYYFTCLKFQSATGSRRCRQLDPSVALAPPPAGRAFLAPHLLEEIKIWAEKVGQDGLLTSRYITLISIKELLLLLQNGTIFFTLGSSGTDCKYLSRAPLNASTEQHVIFLI